jgi:hypothetical protein
MARQHYLPAAFLAGFSEDGATLPRRRRRLVQGDKNTLTCCVALAERLALIHDIYTLQDPLEKEPNIIDNSWAGYESRLVSCIKRLTLGTVDALEWAGVLVPFVTSLLVRGDVFRRRFTARAGDERGILFRPMTTPDNINYARAVEVQRLLGPILAARWIVVKSPEGEGLITTDVAFAPCKTPLGEFGIAIPLDNGHVLQLIPRRQGEIAVASNNKWYPILEHRTLLAGNYVQLNETLAVAAERFIFGSSRTIVERYLRSTDKDRPPIEPLNVGFITGRLRIVHEFTWHRFISAISKHPKGEESTSFDLDWNAIAAAWKPPVVYFPSNLPEFPSALRRRGNFISVDLYDVEGFTHPPDSEAMSGKRDSA